MSNTIGGVGGLNENSYAQASQQVLEKSFQANQGQEGGAAQGQRGDGVDKSDEAQENPEELRKQQLEDLQRDLDRQIQETTARLSDAQSEGGDSDDGHAKGIQSKLNDLQKQRDEVGGALMQMNGGGGDEGGGGGGGGGIGGAIGGLIKGLLG